MNLRYMLDYERLLFFALGAGAVFLGSALHNALAKRKTGKGLTNFQSFLFGTGFVYAGLVLWLTVTFFSDYFRGTAWQGYNIRPDQNALFFAVFGKGMAGEEQFPLLSIDLNFICAVIGGAFGGVCLLAVKEDRNKLRGGDDGVFYGYVFPKRSVKDYFLDEVKALREQITLPEYVFWWIIRIGIVYFLIRSVKEGATDLKLIFSANLAVTFVVPLVRLLFFPKLFLGRMSYRVQSLIDVFVFFGNFLGHGFRFNGTVTDYDKLLHLVSGGVVVFIGCVLIEGTRRGREVPRLSKTLASAGFSCVVMVLWEIFEFFTDFYMEGSMNQNFHYAPAPDMFFFKIFGAGAGKPGQSVVLDTNIDVFLAVVGCVFCTVLLYIFLAERDKREAKRKEEEAEALQTVGA